MKKTTDYQRFNETMEKLLKVPHSQIKAELEAEKKAKKEAPKRRIKKNG